MTAATDLVARTGGELHLVHVWRPIHFAMHSYALPPEPYNLYEGEARTVLRTEEQRAARCGAPVAYTHFIQGRLADEILGLALKIGAHVGHLEGVVA
jgi:hypothetical protein